MPGVLQAIPELGDHVFVRHRAVRVPVNIVEAAGKLTPIRRLHLDDGRRDLGGGAKVVADSMLHAPNDGQDIGSLQVGREKVRYLGRFDHTDGNREVE